MHILHSKFSKQMALATALSLTVIELLGGYSLSELDKSRGIMSQLYTDNMKNADALNKIKVLMLDSRAQVRNALSTALVTSGARNTGSVLALDADSARSSAENINKNTIAIDALWNPYLNDQNTAIEDNQLKRNFDTIKNQFNEQSMLPAAKALALVKYDDANKYSLLATTLIATANSDIDKLIAKEFAGAENKNTVAESRYHALRISFTIFMSGLLLVMCVAGYLIIRSYNRSLMTILRACEAIERGDNAYDIKISGTDEFSKIAKALKSSLAEINRFSEESLRIKLALDKASVGIIIINNARLITYINARAAAYIRQEEGAIKKLIPDFSADHLIGISVDIFHKTPSHQAAMLEKLVDTVTGDFKLGSMQVKIIGAAIFNEKNERLGTVAEWHDLTVQSSSEHELSKLINQVIEGDLTQRINHTKQTGFFKESSAGINTVVEVIDAWIKEFGRIFTSIENGDLTQKIDDNGDDAGAFVELGRHANNTVDNLHQLIEQIAIAAKTIADASDDISEGNTDLSQRTEEQAASLEETAASMEQFAAAVKNNADNSKQANQLAVTTFGIAEKGGDVVNEMVQTMSYINESSNKIVDIISVMDSISFQINILALNAAVEAARAGEQGRGFAVVASEVRSLAHKSAAAAKEIKLLISDSVKKVEAGSKLVADVGLTMIEIISSTRRVSDITNEISAASSEQSIGIDQVNQAIMQMDGVTQQNAALVEQSAAAATAMATEAKSLITMVDGFTLNKRNEPSSKSPLPARATNQKRAGKQSSNTGWESF